MESRSVDNEKKGLLGPLDQILGAAIVVLALGMTLYFVTYSLWRFEGTIPHQNTHLGFGLALVFLVYAKEGKGLPAKAFCLLGFALSLLGTAYVAINFTRLEATLGFAESTDLVIGLLLVVVVLWATWKAWGAALTLLAAICIAYFFWGHYIPPPLGHPPINWTHVLSFLSIGVYGGIYGTYMMISADWIFPFMIFGGLLIALGGGRFFTSVGFTLGRYISGGAGQVTTISSTLLGMVTGSAVASASFGGNFTIPAMKQNGYRPVTAAGIESTCATGAQVMPPIMGAAAFLVAMILGVTYWEVVQASWIPAALYFLTLVLVVRAVAIKQKIPKMKYEVKIDDLILTAPLFLVPVAIIMVLLMLRYSITYVVLWALVSLVVVSFLRKGTRPSWRQFLDGIIQGATAGAAIAVVLGAVGMLAQSITTTGLGVSITGVVQDLSLGYLPLALVWTAIISILLGGPLPTVAAYILVASVAAPLLIRMGIVPMAAHLFALWYGILSEVSPPVAGSALVAARIAGCGYMAASWEATKLSVGLFILPFLFVYNPALIGAGKDVVFSLTTIIATGFLCYALVAGLFGVAWRELRLWERLLWLGDAALLGAFVVSSNYIFLIPALGALGLLLLVGRLSQMAPSVARESPPSLEPKSKG